QRSGRRPAGGIDALDGAGTGWKLAGQGERREEPPPELPGLDFGWPDAPAAPQTWPETGRPAQSNAETEVLESTWPEPVAGEGPGLPAAATPGERSIQAVIDAIQAVSSEPPRGPSRRQQRAERRRRQVGERLRNALAENDRPVLIDLAMSGALAELGESDRNDVLQVVRALSYDAVARAIATDDDEAILASIDRSVFADDGELDSAFRERVRLARQRAEWTERVRVAARERDGRAGAELLRTPPEQGVERLPEAVRRQVTRLAEEQRAGEAAQVAIRRRDANALAVALGRLVEVRPVWTERIDADDVVRLLGAEQIEERLVGLLAGGRLADSDQWMVDLVIASGRLPEVTRLAGLSPRDVDRMIHRESAS
ncbi:MAG TPA: hypothetical protein VFJ99_06230, partial [Solirubrobacterales bacterium]|nr:hypothetical protein [Solirubrobacterales bacterium]